jgi:hypothetical protein
VDINLSNLFMKRDAESRSISAENYRGEKGRGGMATPETTLHKKSAEAARELGVGWKLSPCVAIAPGETVTLMDNDGPGVIRHIWITLGGEFYRNIILRIYWDGEEKPSVECPMGDFMCCSWNNRQNILALPVNVNPSGGMNCYFPMPFRKHARITVENLGPKELPHFFYTINYTFEPVAADALYLHAQWRRTNPVPYGTDYTMIDGVKGQGQYVGTFMSWQQNNNGWWGEGEIKMFLDGDTDFPTICGTGTEDYFCGAWCFGLPPENYSGPYTGFQQVKGKCDETGARMTLYRFHVSDPVFFKSNLRVTMQALGWRTEWRYLPLQDDIASVVYWYQTEPHAVFPALPDTNAREII